MASLYSQAITSLSMCVNLLNKAKLRLNHSFIQLSYLTWFLTRLLELISFLMDNVHSTSSFNFK